MHMSQLTSGCNTWVNNLIHLQDSLTFPSSADPVQARCNSDAASDSDADAMDTSIDQESAAPNSKLFPDLPSGFNDQSPSQSSTSQCGSYHSECFDGAAELFRHGNTFMDKFDRDKFANAHKMNLFYPFMSRKEWELALWLLRSGLSMRAIDTVLSLPIVCAFLSLF
ncbi:hypothetical protein JVU11DRAFT_6272 [Chiua virens]|nr:hypothetical protein JVU11DRAFT_6272 [Chiua virens]